MVIVMVELLRELSDQNAYQRHLAACGVEHSAEEWRRFSNHRLAARFGWRNAASGQGPFFTEVPLSIGVQNPLFPTSRFCTLPVEITRPSLPCLAEVTQE